MTDPTESVPHPELGSLSVQTGAVTSSMSDAFECREGFPSDPEPCTPSPVKHKPPGHLPPHWKSATDSQGKVYYYHAQGEESYSFVRTVALLLFNAHREFLASNELLCIWVFCHTITVTS